MRLEWLRFQNFRGFEDREITLNRDFTVLIGDNRTGKSTVLNGIAIALGGFLNGFVDVRSRHIEKDEVRLQPYLQGEVEHFAPQYPVTISARGIIDDQTLTWIRTLGSEKGRTTRREAVEIVQLATNLQHRVNRGSTELLPVFAYHGTKSGYVKRQKKEEPFTSRFSGYIDCLEPGSSEKLFERWFEEVSWREFREKKESKLLTAVREAVAKCLEHEDHEQLCRAKIDFDPEEKIVVTLTDGTRLPLRLLSDGYKKMIRLVTDIAFRMALLNPSLMEETVLKTPGVVLIDELDVYLHPHWQRRVVDDLKNTFPMVQFIVATHSPFIIQSLEPHELRSLDQTTQDGQTLLFPEVPPESYVGQGVEDVSQNVMGVVHAHWNYKKVLLHEKTQRYLTLLQQAVASTSPDEKVKLQQDVEDLKREVEEMSALFSDNVAYHAILELESQRIKRMGSSNETD